MGISYRKVNKRFRVSVNTSIIPSTSSESVMVKLISSFISSSESGGVAILKSIKGLGVISSIIFLDASTIGSGSLL